MIPQMLRARTPLGPLLGVVVAGLCLAVTVTTAVVMSRPDQHVDISTVRTPLVLIGGKATPLPAGDTLAGVPTNTASANVIPKSDGTNLVASSISDDGTTVTTTKSATIGAVGTSGNVGVGVLTAAGPTRQTVTVPGGAYAFGELNLSTIDGVVPPFPNDLFVSVIRNSATADTTGHTGHSGAIAAEVTSTRSAGANDLTNTAIECSASGAQNNECLHVIAGDIVFDGGGAITQNSGTAFFAGSFLAATGIIYAEGAGTNAIDISGAPTNEIRMRQAASLIDVNNVAASSLTFYNANDGVFRLQLGVGTAPTSGPIFDPQAPTSVSHGSLGAGSSNLVGNVTGVGSNTSTVLTFSNSGFPNHAWCFATPNGHSVTAQFIEVTLSKTAPTFSCFTVTTGAAANCDDFSYQCIGQ